MKNELYKVYKVKTRIDTYDMESEFIHTLESAKRLKEKLENCGFKKVSVIEYTSKDCINWIEKGVV